MPPRNRSFLAALILASSLPSFALSFVPPPPEDHGALPVDSATVSATVLHTRSRSWLQFQVAPVEPCQRVVVDSVRVRDTLFSDTGKPRIRAPLLGAAPIRDLEVRWHLVQEPLRWACQEVRASRQMLELPKARWHADSDSLLARWIPGEIEARGPQDRTTRFFPTLVDQSGEANGLLCPSYSFRPCPFSSWPPDTALRGTFLAMVRERIRQGLPVMEVARDGGLRRTRMPDGDAATTASLGSRESPWNVGQQAWREDLLLRTVRSWGAARLPEAWTFPTGRRIVTWRNAPMLCCTNCDTICDRGPAALGVSVSGVDVEVANDSIRDCAPYSPIDHNAELDLVRHWVVFPDTGEVRTGLFTKSLRSPWCNSRPNAWPVVGDSVRYEGIGVALAELDGIVVGTTPRRSHPAPRIRATATGLDIRTGYGPDVRWTVVARDHSGRILSSTATSGPSALLAVSERGALLVEIRGPDGVVRRQAVR